jgi:hypothetical protein
MKTKATATLIDGTKVTGWITTEHAASSYGQPIFVDGDNQAYDWINVKEINTAADLGHKGGSSTSEAKASASRANGAKGGRPHIVREEGS